ncbi:MAG: ATP-binding protein [Candidatus Omnitrophica bacterium]|nr:ATP-binding protein [Candidatus Omnitrophota bacterium]
MKIIRRRLDLKLPSGKSAFLWGPRKVGKTFWIEHHLPEATVLDFLKSEVFAEFSARPELLREKFIHHKGLIVIDEVQKVPAILNEVQWLIDHKKIAFLLTGSSARKLRRGQANLLGGRAWRYTMVPLSFMEVQGFDLEKVAISGLLPPHFLSPDPLADIRAYVADYLKEEIASEALVQNIPDFSEFLRIAALTSSELLNYVNVGRECGVSHKVVRRYFDILEDTYLGFRIKPWRKSKNRRMILTEKFYLFDVGIANYLARRRPLLGSSEFGKSFEHYILMELRAYQAYKNPDLPIHFWRTASGQEVDFIVGDRELAVEIKASRRVHEGDIRGLMALREDGPVKKRVVVSLEKEPRWLSSGIDVLPWKIFLERLWSGEWI